MFTIREFRDSDDILAITNLLHRAYAPLAAQGLRFTATHQSPEVTKDRIKCGQCFVATDVNDIVGTITIRPPDPESPIKVYREPGTFSFGQFAVAPPYKGRGLGTLLHQKMIEHVRSNQGAAAALDTAAPASQLIQMYQRWGYEEIERFSWETTNYESVILRKKLK